MMSIVFLSLVFAVVFICSFLAMHKGDLFGGFKVPLALCTAGLAVVGLNTTGAEIAVGMNSTILLPYQALAITLIGLLFLVLLDRLFFGLSRLKNQRLYRKTRKDLRPNIKPLLSDTSISRRTNFIK